MTGSPEWDCQILASQTGYAAYATLQENRSFGNRLFHRIRAGLSAAKEAPVERVIASTGVSLPLVVPTPATRRTFAE
jgi:hypothetical protein